MHMLYLLLCGAIMGVAEIIPGVSGGTLAVVLNIYDRLVDAIGNFMRDVKKNLLFLVPLVAGMGLSIVALSHVMKYLLSHFPMEMNFLFLGLLLGVIPMLFRSCTKTAFRPINLIPFFLLLVLMVALAVVPVMLGNTTADQVYTTMTGPLFVRFLFTGALGALCFILPGISGSMMMKTLGIYDSVIAAIADLNVIMLVPVAIGGLCGLLFGAKLIAYCLKRFPQGTHYAILGLVVGAAAPLYVKSGFVLLSLHGAVSLGIFVVALIVAFLMSRLSKD